MVDAATSLVTAPVVEGSSSWICVQGIVGTLPEETKNVSEDVGNCIEIYHKK